MANIYGHLWTSRFRSEDQLSVAQSEWLLAFERNGLTARQIGKALDTCEDKLPMPPTLPGFIELAGGYRIAAHQNWQAPKRINIGKSERKRRMQQGNAILSDLRQQLETSHDTPGETP